MTAPRTILVAIWLASLAGCGRVVFQPSTPQSRPIAMSPEQQQQLAQQQQQFESRATALDRDNQELEALLAQSRQETQLLREQVTATQQQLRATAERLAQAQQEKSEIEGRTQALMASAKQPGAASIQANNTLLRPLSCTNMPDVEARQDGDTIRVSVAADQLFSPGSAQLAPGGEQVLRAVASDLLANYPEQVIGIEGHTDAHAPTSAQFPTPHHLTVAQATTVYDVFRRAAGAPPQQLFVIGHGANHPLFSNGAEAGRQKNRRIEVVVYPETVRRR